MLLPTYPQLLKLLSLASLSLVHSASAVTVIDSPTGAPVSTLTGTGLNARFGLSTALGLTTVGSTTDVAQQITGDPTASFSDYYSPNFNLLSTYGAVGDTFSMTYDIYVPAGSVGITGSAAYLRWYGDTGAIGTLQFGAGGDFLARKENFSAGINLALRDQWQTVTVTGAIPLVDTAGVPIDRFEYGITLPQAGEDANQAVNSLVDPVNVWVRNINLTFTAPVPEPGAAGLGILALSALAFKRRRK
jgi:MYXO-CTERM domain-containing protein